MTKKIPTYETPEYWRNLALHTTDPRASQYIADMYAIAQSINPEPVEEPGFQFASMQFLVLDGKGKPHNVSMTKLEGGPIETTQASGDQKLIIRRMRMFLEEMEKNNANNG